MYLYLKEYSACETVHDQFSYVLHEIQQDILINATTSNDL